MPRHTKSKGGGKTYAQDKSYSRLAQKVRGNMKKWYGVYTQRDMGGPHKGYKETKSSR